MLSLWDSLFQLLQQVSPVRQVASARHSSTWSPRAREAEKKAQIAGLGGQTSDYLTSTRARYRTSCLLVHGVGMLTYARCLARKNAFEAFPSESNSFYPRSRYRYATFFLPINPALSVTASAGGRYFVYGPNYPLLPRTLYSLFFLSSCVLFSVLRVWLCRARKRLAT